jgi:HAD superfamily hydrolase (TIGR01484 family)
MLKFFRDYREEIKKDMGQVRVIYSDLDGTLLNDKGCLIKDRENNFFIGALEQIEKLFQKDIDIVLISGRNKVQLRFNAKILGVKNYIAELGCELVYDQGKKVHFTFDNERFKYDFRYQGRDLQKVIDILKNAFPNKIEGKPEWAIYRSTNALFLGDVDIKSANRLLRDNGYGEAELVNNGPTLLENVSLDLKKIYIYNLMPKGVGKINGVRLDKKIRNFKRENCIALGDSMEDLKLASEVKYFFMMENTIEEEKDIIGALKNYDNVFVSDNAMNRGWAEVISYLF